MHRAIDLLYCPCGVCLEKQKTKETRIDGTVWDRITEYIYHNKGFSSDMLTHKDVRALIDETATVLSYAISESITEETPEELIEQLEDNAYIFSGFKTYHSLSEVSLSMTDDKGRLKSFDTFRKDVEKINDKYNVRYLEAEYNQAVASAQMAARWANFSNDTKRYMLQYRTAQDNKVRDSHRALEGVTLDKNDAFWDSYLPPNGWGCRCTTVEVLAREYNKTDSEVAIKTAEAITYGKHERIFRFNPGKEKRLFPDKHPYFGKKGIAHCSKDVSLAKGDDDPCRILEKVIDAKERSQASIERQKYMQEMKHLLKVKKVKTVDNGKKINVGFSTYGNKHLYSDTFGRTKLLNKEDLKNLDKLLSKAVYIGSSELTHKRKDNIDHFHYFSVEINGGVIRLNVAEYARIKSDGQVFVDYFLYSINDIKK